MNKLLIDKNYKQVIELFEMQFDKFSVERSNSISKNKNNAIIPFDQLTLVSEALFYTVSFTYLI